MRLEIMHDGACSGLDWPLFRECDCESVTGICAFDQLVHWYRDVAYSIHRAQRPADTCMQATAVDVAAQHLLCMSLQLCRSVKRQEIMHACLGQQTTSSMQLPCDYAACTGIILFDHMRW